MMSQKVDENCLMHEKMQREGCGLAEQSVYTATAPYHGLKGVKISSQGRCICSVKLWSAQDFLRSPGT